jgi:HNH endonuclease
LTSREQIQQIREISKRLSGRAKIVVDTILEKGFITTEDLEKKHGYAHAPRAARDVRELGIPLETYRVKSTDGQSIAAYRFGDLSKVREGRLAGRLAFPKHMKEELYETGGGRCYICRTKYEERYLQIDHRVPYEVSGDSGSFDLKDYALICVSCNRAKSWSCEHCANWTAKDPSVCAACYWASPTEYSHIAMEPIRRLDMTWRGDEVKDYDKLKKKAEREDTTVRKVIKNLVRRYSSE